MSRRHISDLTGQLRQISQELEHLTFDAEPETDDDTRSQRRGELEQKARRTWDELGETLASLSRQSSH